MEASKMRPTAGVRYALERASEEESATVYRGFAHLPDQGSRARGSCRRGAWRRQRDARGRQLGGAGARAREKRGGVGQGGGARRAGRRARSCRGGSCAGAVDEPGRAARAEIMLKGFAWLNRRCP